jgi:hypothetical protein
MNYTPTLEDLKKCRSIFSNLIQANMKECIEDKWYKFLLHAQGMCGDSIIALERQQNITLTKSKHSSPITISKSDKEVK